MASKQHLTKKDADLSVNFNKSLWFSQNSSQFPETYRGLLSKKCLYLFFLRVFIRNPPDVLRKKPACGPPFIQILPKRPETVHLRRKWCYTARVPYLLKGRTNWQSSECRTPRWQWKNNHEWRCLSYKKVVAILVYSEDSFTELGSTSNLKLS